MASRSVSIPSVPISKREDKSFLENILGIAPGLINVGAGATRAYFGDPGGYAQAAGGAVQTGQSISHWNDQKVTQIGEENIGADKPNSAAGDSVIDEGPRGDNAASRRINDMNQQQQYKSAMMADIDNVYKDLSSMRPDQQQVFGDFLQQLKAKAAKGNQGGIYG